MAIIKLNKAQKEKFDNLRAYLNRKEDNDGMGVCAYDNDVSLCAWIDNIYINAFGIFVSGKDVHAKSIKRDRLFDATCITDLYRAIKKNDDDFNIWLKERGEA